MNRRRRAFLAAGAALALAFAACGDDEETTSTTSRDATVQADASGTAGSKRADADPPVERSGSAGADASTSDGEAPVAPLRVTGGGSEQFRVRGADNSISEFGEEADEGELTAAAEALHAYFVARAEGDWAGACSYLSARVASQLEELAASAPELRGKGCAPVLAALATGAEPGAARELTEVDAVSLRVDGEQAFLIYRGADDAVLDIPMAREDDAWKAGALLPTPLSSVAAG